jgi:hypothetical protein
VVVMARPRALIARAVARDRDCFDYAFSEEQLEIAINRGKSEARYRPAGLIQNLLRRQRSLGGFNHAPDCVALPRGALDDHDDDIYQGLLLQMIVHYH